MDKNTEIMGRSAARWLQSEVDAGEAVRVLVNASDLQFLLDYVKALEAPEHNPENPLPNWKGYTRK